MSRCNGCGLCCEAIPMAAPIEYYQRGAAGENADSPNFQFIAKHWYEINPELGAHLVPELALNPDHPIYWMSCDQYDQTTKACKAYEDRPPVCSGFPWYGGEQFARYLPRPCGYWLDMKPEDRPEWAAPALSEGSGR